MVSLVIQIVLAVLLAPLLAGERWSTNPLLLVVLGISLAVLAAGTAVLASAGAVAAMVIPMSRRRLRHDAPHALLRPPAV